MPINPLLAFDQSFSHPIIGIDEVGRGPLAGPVVAGAVYIPQETYTLPFWAHVNDSKKLSSKRRGELAAQIQAHTIWGLGQASVDEIDTVNILQATFLAMRRAFEDLSSPRRQVSGETRPTASLLTSYCQIPAFAGMTHCTALIDGNRAPRDFPVPVQTVIKGDATSLSIAAASIIAKVARDQLMTDLARDYPAYGWGDNAGYGTASHMAALAAHGPCPHHRRSFAPIKTLYPLAG